MDIDIDMDIHCNRPDRASDILALAELPYKKVEIWIEEDVICFTDLYGNKATLSTFYHSGEEVTAAIYIDIICEDKRHPHSKTFNEVIAERILLGIE